MKMRSIFWDCVTLSIDPVLDTGNDVIRQKKNFTCEPIRRETPKLKDE